MIINFKQIKYNKSEASGRTIEYIVIHDTGNFSTGANAEMHYRYFNTGDRSASADFFVDSTQILQVNDYNKYFSYHCGDGRGAYGITNRNSIGIEMCVNKDGNYATTVDNTKELVKKLLKDLGLSVDKVVRHYDASRKKCPASMSANNWFNWNVFKSELSISPTIVKPLVIGDKISLSNASLYADSFGGGYSSKITGVYRIARYIPDRTAGVLLEGGIGWVSESECTVVSDVISVGDKVKVVGTNYATGQLIPSWVKANVYTVGAVEGDRVLLKEITSFVFKKDVIKV